MRNDVQSAEIKEKISQQLEKIPGLNEDLNNKKKVKNSSKYLHEETKGLVAEIFGHYKLTDNLCLANVIKYN